MGYAGRVQRLCKSGHLSEIDAYEDEADICPFCDEEIIWWDSGEIELEELTPAKVEKCNLGYDHIVAHATYKNPYEGD